MRYINLRLTYLLTYLLSSRGRDSQSLMRLSKLFLNLLTPPDMPGSGL